MQQGIDLVKPSRDIYASKLLQGVYMGMSYLPWLWLGTFALSVLVTALQVGHWPSYNNPDPSAGGPMTLVRLIAYLLMLVVLGMTPVWLGLELAGLVLPKLRRDFPPYTGWREVGIYLSGMGVYYMVVWKDVINLMTWFWD